MPKMSDTPSSQEIRSAMRDWLQSHTKLLEIIAKLPEESQKRLRAEMAEPPVIRSFKILRRRTKP
jgi:hypothetical protein